jgi:hypothetical protein
MTRGLIEAIQTNRMTASGAFTYEMFVNWLFMGRQNNVATSDILLVGSSLTKLTIDRALGPDQQLPMSRTEAGTNITTIVTPFGTLDYEINDFVPNGVLLYIHVPSLGLKEMDTPGKGNWFVEPLAKTGAKEADQIWGLMGLDYGAEWNHMMLTGFTSATTTGVTPRDLTRTGRSAKDPNAASAGVVGGHTGGISGASAGIAGMSAKKTTTPEIE